MTRLTDADALIDVLNSQACADWLSEQDEYTPASIVEHALETLPTVDAEPVKHGKWIPWKYHNGYRCDKCNEPVDNKHNYCPNCGARMDAEE